MKRVLLLAGALAALAGMSIGSAAAQDGDARVRVLHASPDAPNVDVYVDGAEAISDLPFSEITDYISLPAGDYDVAVYAASANGEGDPVIAATLTLDAGVDYTVAAINEVAAIEPLVLVDNNGAPAAGNAHVRFVHASPDAPNVDIAAEGAGVLIADTAFGSASEYLPVPAGSYNLDVLVAGTQDSALAVPGVSLQPGNVYTVFALGFAAGDPALSAKLVVDSTHEQHADAPATGNAGLVATNGDAGSTQWVAIAGIASLMLAVAVGAVALGTRRLA